MTDTIRLTDPAIIIAGIRQFGLAPDGSDLRDLEAAIDRLQGVERRYKLMLEAARSAASSG